RDGRVDADARPLGAAALAGGLRRHGGRSSIMTLVIEPDYGTPEVEAAKTATVTIDAREVTVPAGTSVMRAAAQAGIEIPRLCATDSLKAFGSCRLCLVEVDGAKGTPASCTTPCSDGMVVRT